jgi:hypothetical protein
MLSVQAATKVVTWSRCINRGQHTAETPDRQLRVSGLLISKEFLWRSSRKGTPYRYVVSLLE